MAEEGWRLLASGLDFPEGPAFAPDGALWCVELKAGRLARWESGRLDRIEVGGAPNGIAMDGDGAVWFCDAAACSIRRWFQDRCETVCEAVDGEPLYKPNDLCFDRAGNLIFTCPGDSRTMPAGYVCCREPGGSVRKISEGLYFPNGVALSPDGSELFLAETYSHRIWRGGWDSEWRSPKPWAQAGGPVGPDGLAVDDAGLVYAAVYGQQAVRVFDSEGRLVRSLQTPGRKPTNLAFDPSGALGLVLTEAEQGCLWSWKAL